MLLKNSNMFGYESNKWAQVSPSEFYDNVINNIPSDDTLYTEIGNFSYYFINTTYLSNTTVLCIKWIDENIADKIKHDEFINIWKYSKSCVEYSKTLTKKELTEHFNVILRKDKLNRIKKEI